MKTFGGTEIEYASIEKANTILQSIPYDGTSTWKKGADKGFAAFLEAVENMELYDIETDYEVVKKGIHITDPWVGFNSPDQMFHTVYQETKRLLNTEKFLTFFGGEHSVSIGIMKAFSEQFKDLTILQIDAHADLRPVYKGSPYNHACAVYDISRNCQLIQVGIRSMDRVEKKYMNPKNVFFAHQMHRTEDWMEKSIGRMTENVYITFDLDAFDPSIMPATGTPEPGGLYWWTTLKYLRKVFSKKHVTGFDIVEFAPLTGMHAPQFLVAKLYYKMLSYKFSNYAK